jgi:hypothetical protein
MTQPVRIEQRQPIYRTPAYAYAFLPRPGILEVDSNALYLADIADVFHHYPGLI